MLRPTSAPSRKDSIALRFFAQQSLIRSVETQLDDANRRVKELESLLSVERAKTNRLELENSQLRENWRAICSQGTAVTGGHSLSARGTRRR